MSPRRSLSALIRETQNSGQPERKPHATAYKPYPHRMDTCDTQADHRENFERDHREFKATKTAFETAENTHFTKQAAS